MRPKLCNDYRTSDRDFTSVRQLSATFVSFNCTWTWNLICFIGASISWKDISIIHLFWGIKIDNLPFFDNDKTMDGGKIIEPKPLLNASKSFWVIRFLKTEQLLLRITFPYTLTIYTTTPSQNNFPLHINHLYKNFNIPTDPNIHSSPFCHHKLCIITHHSENYDQLTNHSI